MTKLEFVKFLCKKGVKLKEAYRLATKAENAWHMKCDPGRDEWIQMAELDREGDHDSV